ncbi:MAG: DUF4935 domain-containing protein [Flavobacteriaceae bacterium]|nr:DUF4935 domain-containing protein [Flavobacteriaceae bacterium]
MSKEVVTEKIFIDTSVFIKENFFAGIKLNALIKHAREQEIELYTTKITVEECLSNIEKQFRQGKNLFKKVIRNLNVKAKILKNVETLKQVFEIEESFDTENELDHLKNEFQELIDENFRNIPIDTDKTTKILTDYFKEDPPFGDGGKKHEFPDAFVLNSLESWCQNQNEKIYVLSDDDDFLSFKSKRLIPVREYDKLLNLISYTYSEENIIAKVEETIATSEKEIIKSVIEEFEIEFPTDGLDNSYGYEYYLASIEDVDFDYLDHSILSIYDNKAIVEVNLKGHYSVEIGYDDLSTGFYDKEDGRYYGVEQSSQIISDSIELTIELNVYVDLPGKPAIWKWELEGILKGIPEGVSLE